MKKNVILIIGIFVVVIAIAVSLIFVLTPDKNNTPQDKIDLSGNWTVVANYVNDTPTFTEQHFASFKDGVASFYKKDTTTAYVTSSYTINDVPQLILSDVSREYKIDKKTDNCIRLYEDTKNYMLLVKAGSEIENVPFSATDLNGKWNIAMKGDQYNNGEVLEFVDGQLKYYKSNNPEPVATADFMLEDSIIKADSLGMEFRCYLVTDGVFVLVENTGIVWELVRK